jgi:hypothetical protein
MILESISCDRGCLLVLLDFFVALASASIHDHGHVPNLLQSA